MVRAATAFAAALVLWLAFSKPVPACIAAAIGTLVLSGGLFCPALSHALERAAAWLGRTVGMALTWILLVPFFYIVFTAARVCILLARRDPLHLRFPAPDVDSFWTERPPMPDVDTYERQY